MSVADLTLLLCLGDGQFYALSVDIAYYCVSLYLQSAEKVVWTWVFPNPSS